MIKKIKSRLFVKVFLLTLLLARNPTIHTQTEEAIQKTLPVLCIVVLFGSIISTFFYSWYMTVPIKKVSKFSKRMADMDFGGFCSDGRTDEIGVLSESLNTLSQKLEATLSELQEANQKLQADIDMERRLEKQRVEFFDVASHELKTPITIIKGQLQGMLYQVGRYKDRETYLAESLEVIDTLERMVKELLTISRLDASGYTCKKCNLNLSDLINDRLTAFEDLFMQKGLTVEQSISPEVYILGDIQLLQKVLDNLCNYLDEHGETVYDFNCFVETNAAYSINAPKLVSVAERDKALLTYKEEMQKYLNGLSEAEITVGNIKKMLIDKSAELANSLSAENMRSYRLVKFICLKSTMQEQKLFSNEKAIITLPVAQHRREISANPKHMQWEINSQLENKGIGTKAQQALKLQHEQNKIERKTQSR